MKSSLIKILVFGATFLIGMIAFLYLDIFCTNKVEVELSSQSMFAQIPTQTSICQLEESPKDFDGKFVSFKATTYTSVNSTVMLVSKGCSYTENFPEMILSTKLELNSYVGTYNNLETLLDFTYPTNQNDSTESGVEVDIQVTGRAKITYDVEGYKWYSIIPADIKIISPMRKFEPKAYGN